MHQRRFVARRARLTAIDSTNPLISAFSASTIGTLGLRIAITTEPPDTIAVGIENHQGTTLTSAGFNLAGAGEASVSNLPEVDLRELDDSLVVELNNSDGTCWQSAFDASRIIVGKFGSNLWLYAWDYRW